MPADRIEQIEREIDEILTQPLPAYPERYIPREALHALMTELLTLQGFSGGDHRQIDLAARKFAIDNVPQNVFSYPMAQRETRIMAVDPEHLAECLKRPTAPPMNADTAEANRAALHAVWGGA